MKVIAMMYVLCRTRLLPRADIVSLLTVISVCRKWSTIVIGRRINRKQIRYFFRTQVIIQYGSLHSMHLTL